MAVVTVFYHAEEESKYSKMAFSIEYMSNLKSS
jgi:hypothetical protein